MAQDRIVNATNKARKSPWKNPWKTWSRG